MKAIAIFYEFDLLICLNFTLIHNTYVCNFWYRYVIFGYLLWRFDSMLLTLVPEID